MELISVCVLRSSDKNYDGEKVEIEGLHWIPPLREPCGAGRKTVGVRGAGGFLENMVH